MKKLNYLTIFLTILVFPSFAQTFRAHLAGGLSVSHMENYLLSSYRKPGFLVGMGVSYPITEKLLISPELFFIQKGTRSTAQSLVWYDWRLNYLEMPLVLKYVVHEKFSAHAGLAVDILLSSKFEDTRVGVIDDNFELNTLSICSALGFGYHFSEKVSMDVRHIHSLTPISTNFIINLNNTIAVYLTYRPK